MTYEMYRYVFLGAGAASAVFAVISLVLFFTLKIPSIISDLTGRTARKAVEDIRKQNEQTGDKTFKSSAVNLERGKLTDKISKSGRIVSREDSPFGTGVITEKIATQRLSQEDPADETTVLQTGDETTVLGGIGAETSVLNPVAAETTVLGYGGAETTVLSTNMEQPAVAFEIEFEITYIHTNEQID